MQVSWRRVASYGGAALLGAWISFWMVTGSFWGLFQYTYVVGVSSFLYYGEIPSRKEFFEGALRGVVEQLGDPHSSYLDEASFANLKQQTSGSYVGIGIVLGEKGGYPVIRRVFEGSPAAQAGLRPGMHILQADGHSLEGRGAEEAVGFIKGPVDTRVTLVLRAPDGTEVTQTLERTAIDLPTLTGHMIAPHIGYIRIDSFNEQVIDRFGALYTHLLEEGMQGLVLDLRSNPGGLLQAAVTVGSYVLPHDTVVAGISTAFEQSEWYRTGQVDTTRVPIVVLVDSHSASASEIVAADIQEQGRGLILGQPTYGKGTVQTILPVPWDGGGIRVTISRYVTSNGSYLPAGGVQPNIVYEPALAPSAYSDHDAEVQQAISLLQQHPFPIETYALPKEKE